MAVVYGHSTDSGRVVFFFQDTAGYLCCRYVVLSELSGYVALTLGRRKIGQRQWEPKVQIVKACLRTGITLAKLKGMSTFSTSSAVYQHLHFRHPRLLRVLPRRGVQGVPAPVQLL
jgi:hypothetical protein